MLVRNADDLLFSISRSLHRPALSLGRTLAPSGENSQRQITAKVRSLGKAALGRYPLVGDRLGQCMVSDGFETRKGSADKAKPIQTKKIAIHTLGQKYAFATVPNQVGFPPVGRRSRPSVGNASVCRRSNAPGRTHALCHKATFLEHRNMAHRDAG